MKHIQLLLVLLITQLALSAQKYEQAYAAGNFEKAIKYAEKAIEADGKNLDAYLIKAMANYHLGSDSATREEQSFGIESAFSTLKLIIRKDKSGAFVEAHQAEADTILFAIYTVANTALEKGKTDKAERIINDLIEIEPKPAYYYLVGKMWFDQGNEFKAIAMFNDAAAKIYLDNKAGKKPEPYLFEIFQVLAENIALKGDYTSAYTIFNRALLLFDENEIDEVYYKFLFPIAEYNYFSYDTLRQKSFIFNLDTAAQLTQNPQQFNELKWKMLVQFYTTNVADNYYEGAGFLSEYVCAESKKDFNQFFYHQIIDATQVSVTIDGSVPLDGRQYMFTWLRLQDCLYGRNSNTAMLYVMDSLLQNQHRVEASKWLYNLKIQKVDAKKITEYEQALYQLIKNADTAQFAFMDLYDLTFYFPQNKNFKLLQEKGAYAEIVKLINNNQFSAAGKLLRKQIRTTPNDKTINDLYKRWVIADYQTNYLGSAYFIDNDEWGGSVESCEPGKLTAEMQKKFLQRLNYVRRVAGVPDNCELRESWNAYCQSAALMMTAEGDLSHFPGKDWKCYSPEGAKGASNSNLSYGYSAVGSLMGQLDDSGANNYFVGHRRWILNPSRKVFGHGSTAYAMALWALGGENSDYDEAIVKEFETQYVCWPPEFYFPAALNTARWSFSLRGANFDNVTVEMYWGNKKIDVSIQEWTPGYGMSTIVWEPQTTYYDFEPENRYKIVIKNVGIEYWDEAAGMYISSPKNFTYYTTKLY